MSEFQVVSTTSEDTEEGQATMWPLAERFPDEVIAALIGRQLASTTSPPECEWYPLFWWGEPGSVTWTACFCKTCARERETEGADHDKQLDGSKRQDASTSSAV